MSTLTLAHTPCGPAHTRRVSLFSLMSLARQRRALATLSAAQLDDIGLTRTQALDESRRFPWDIPDQRSSCR
jgi:uncharacterized protein YjiS (DUF1127 family)